MSDTGHLFKYPVYLGYMLACRCTCGHVVLVPTTSPEIAARQLFGIGWLNVRGRGYVCGECAAQARERALMGETAHV